MKRNRIILTALGLLFSILPPLFAVLTYFPIWTARGGAALLSGTALLLILISFIPLFRLIKEHLKSPSLPTVWFIIFAVFFVLAEIADEIKVIALVGFIGNIIGTALFRLAKRQAGGNSDERI